MNPPRNKPPLPPGLPQPFKPGPRVPSVKPVRPKPGVLQPKMSSSVTHSHNIPSSAASPIQPVIQCATPPGARGKVRYYRIAGRDRATDGISYWYKNHRGAWTRIRKGAVPSYNRFQPTKSGKGAPRKASLALRMGSAASYSDLRIRLKPHRIASAQVREVVAATRSKRAYSQNMLAATTLEGEFATNSATAYAAHFGAPVLPGGYNWCHLIGHGAGGSDLASNIMSASTHCNSEQLQIEKVAYQYKSQGVALSCEAEKYRHASYLASKITYHVWVKGKKVYTREMNGFRAAKPTISELEAVREDLTQRITAALQ